MNIYDKGYFEKYNLESINTRTATDYRGLSNIEVVFKSGNTLKFQVSSLSDVYDTINEHIVEYHCVKTRKDKIKRIKSNINKNKFKK